MPSLICSVDLTEKDELLLVKTLHLQVPSRRFNEVEKGQQIEREEGAEGTKTEGQAV